MPMERADFSETYKQLNTEQKLAVDHIEGPLLVVAGPGTGKTQLLSARVANILDKTDASPENILCLTFTNKAATNMSDRLIQLIGTSASAVNVKTFHSFAGEIMNQYPDYFWNGARLTIVPESVQLELIQSIQLRLPLDNPLARKFAGEFTGTKDIQDGLKLAKEAGLTPEKLESIITTNISYIDVLEPRIVEILDKKLSYKTLESLRQDIAEVPRLEIAELIAPLLPLDQVLIDSLNHAIENDRDSGKTKFTGQWKRKWVQSINGEKGMFNERRRNEWWLELANFYKLYRDTLHVRGYYDYSDMLVEVIDQLENQPEALADIQERYQYVMIDEFQDTNAAQLRLAHLIADHYANDGRPNLMVVGDDDQSIFKFNGAELNNMLGFRKSYKIDKPIVLTQNYRSTQKLLDAAKQIAEQAEDRIVNREPDLSKELVAASKTEHKSELLHLVYKSQELEMTGVAKHIKEAYNEKTTFAVLARNHSSLRLLAGILHANKVPLKYEKQNNILDNDAVKQICLLAEVVVSITNGDEESINYSIHKLISHPLWQVDAKTLWEMAVANRYQPHWLLSLENHENTRLSKLAAWLKWLSTESSKAPLTLLLEYLTGLRATDTYTSQIRDYYVNNSISQEYIETLSALQNLRRLVDDFSYHRQATLEDFVRFVKFSQENEQVISDESIFVSSDKAVQLLTVHKAKGLEFDNVYIIDATDHNWRPRSGGRKPPANLPLQPYGDDYDDYIRLMYVAFTRAKKNVYISSYSFNGSNDEVLASPIISTVLEPTEVRADKEQIVEALEANLSWPSLETSSKKHILSSVLGNYQLSVTALLNFLDVTNGGPRYFEKRNLLRLPEAKTTSQAYGTAIHAALEKAQSLTNKNAFSFDAIITHFQSALTDENLSQDEYQKFKIKGEQTLDRLFNSLGYKLRKGSLQEQNLSDILVGPARIGGKLDRIDTRDKNNLLIVDYKTGKPLSSFDTKDQSKAVKAWRQKLQLIFYALLTKKAPRFTGYRNVEGEMVYVEAENSNQLSRAYTPTEEDIERLESLIIKVWDKIQQVDLPDTEHYSKDISGIQAFIDDLLSSKF